MRILYIGCVDSSATLLKELIRLKCDIVGVVTKHESKVNADFNDLSLVCKESGIDYKYVTDINCSESIEYIKSKKPDIIYCFGWSQIIKKDILSIPPKGTIGFHPAKLPNNRGRHPIIWALVLGLKETASTFFLMDEGADTGDIISQEKVIIEYEDTAEILYKKILDAAVLQVVSFTTRLENDTCPFFKQDKSVGNSWRKRGKSDGCIDWRMSSYSIYNLVRGLTKPYVGAHFNYLGKEYKVWKAKEIITNEYENIEPGKVIEVMSDSSFVVKAGNNLVHVIEHELIEVEEGEYLV